MYPGFYGVHLDDVDTVSCLALFVVLCCVVSCCVVLCCVVLGRVVLVLVLVLCCVVLCCVVLCRVVLCCVVPCRVVSCRAVSCRIVSCRVVSCFVLSLSCPCPCLVLSYDSLILSCLGVALTWIGCGINGEWPVLWRTPIQLSCRQALTLNPNPNLKP